MMPPCAELLKTVKLWGWCCIKMFEEYSHCFWWGWGSGELRSVEGLPEEEKVVPEKTNVIHGSFMCCPLVKPWSQYQSMYKDPSKQCHASKLDQTLRGSDREILTSSVARITACLQPTCTVQCVSRHSALVLKPRSWRAENNHVAGLRVLKCYIVWFVLSLECVCSSRIFK